MTKSNLWLYSEAPIDEDTPAWIDKIDEHGALSASFPIPDFIPFDPALDVTIRIDMDGYSYIKDKKDQLFNYCSVTYDDSDKVWYYFIRSAKWRANNTLALVLHMDVINTLLKTDDLSTCMEARTMILREHENRFSSIGFTGVGAVKQLDYRIKVDDIGEGLGSVVLRKTSSEKITDDYFDGDDLKSTPWTVYYGKKKDDLPSMYLMMNPVKGDLYMYNGTRIKVANSEFINYTYSGATKWIELPYFPFVEPIHHVDDDYYSFGNGVLIKDEKASADDKWIHPSGSVSVGTPYGSGTLYNSGRKIAIANEVYANAAFAVLPSTYLQTGRFIKDTKLLHSDFYSLRYVYDSFSFSPSFERMTATSSQLAYEIYFIATEYPSSTFAFKFVPSGFAYREASDYEQWVIATRNNERMLFTDDYVNYLRNGYNYDSKQKSLNAINSLVVRPLTGALTGAINPVYGVVGTVTGLVSGIIGTIQDENSMSKKLAEEQSKSISTVGSDNLDIMRAVTDNKLWKFIYEPSDRIKTMLDDLFYYYGYKRGYQGVPNASSRKWFNFVQCEPKWKPSFARSSKPFLDELAQKFRNGITFFHYNELPSKPSWMSKQGYDLDQKSENWETIITGV
nr:MAG TPA: Major tail protein [Caudoviricetes sp.]